MVSRREQLKRRLRARRASVGLSQMEVAVLAGMSQTRYWQIENGYTEPTQAEADSLAKILHVQNLTEAAS